MDFSGLTESVGTFLGIHGILKDMGSETIAATVPDDSHLWLRFEEYRRSRALASKSEAARELLTAGLELELDYGGRKTLLDGNESLLLSLAFILSAESLISAFTLVFGVAIAAIIFATIGTLIGTWLIYDYRPLITARFREVTA
jgi:hypothetical protein